MTTLYVTRPRSHGESQMTLDNKSGGDDIALHFYGRGFIETADAAPITAHYIPAVDYVRQDWQHGTLARVTRDRRRVAIRHVIYFVGMVSVMTAGIVGGITMAIVRAM